jgi:hypothetical protein
MHAGRQISRQSVRLTERQACRQADQQTGATQTGGWAGMQEGRSANMMSDRWLCMQTGRPANRYHTDRRMGMHAGRQISRQSVRLTERHACRQADQQT